MSESVMPADGRSRPELFHHDQFGDVRTITEDGTVLFCARDVALALGYGRPSNAIARHCKGAPKRGTLETPGGAQELRFIGGTNTTKRVA
ncbi:Bro-N domain-containing protein [Corynebacterium sp.]|uniref:BRO-N domain-containing protein n=1 Tax=Corynebacterium sp. TaxID=1720 RepID=UPI0026DB2484|nr:Bro-N domain-containing protein [Corynebacterium sp.]MDO4610963.1 Bro-N domain-containing protein [Corynebacterium sp.]